MIWDAEKMVVEKKRIPEFHQMTVPVEHMVGVEKIGKGKITFSS